MPKGNPPKKKLKQTDLRISFQQSRVGQKQTARDDKSGEKSQASDNVQKTMAPSVKKEDEAGPSKDLQQEVEEKKHAFNFCINSKSKTYSVVCTTSMTVLEALNTSQFFSIEKDKQKKKLKEILIQRSNGKVPRAAVKTDFPCCLIEEDEIFDITFIQKDGNSSTNQQTTIDPSLLSKRSKPETLVTFLVEKEGGPKVTYLLKSAALRKSVRYVCVFAFKGEEIKTALKRDGRFNDVIFEKTCALSESGTVIKHEFVLPVTKTLNKKTFQVVVSHDNNQLKSQDDVTHVNTEPNEASDADAAENGPCQNPINTEQEKKQDGNTTKSTNPTVCLPMSTYHALYQKLYVAKPIDKSEEIAKILRDQCEDLWKTVKQRENLKNKSQVQKFFREEYHKSAENFLEVKKVRELIRLSDSVCQIRVGESPVGTGFLLFDRFILTNAHVIGELDTFSMKTFTAVFGYEGLEAKETKHIQVKQLIASFNGKDDSGRYLDYALLELDSVGEIAKYPKLLRCYSPNPPNRGQICIVGHPGEGVKKMDPCIIIERENLQEAADKHKSENEHLIHVMMEVCAEQKWDPLAYKNQITYNSCFFHGSSGSPVFDEHCKLIGIHTGGYKYKQERSKTWSVMEYGFSMQPILDNIKAQARAHFKDINEMDEFVNNLERAAENQTDVEMVDAEELIES
ncbi:serine protease FAM111A [Rhinichthys klamathensis goyatoka]|uniref:serine protease FAM111A n=1 Tax=Rhinichthys klamathensis goyatoka TaxID=3034132 RepID=UPI0024B52F23|nr:serine protease FAM111A [Rhinichthys klamathensis goyatoka]